MYSVANMYISLLSFNVILEFKISLIVGAAIFLPNCFMVTIPSIPHIPELARHNHSLEMIDNLVPLPPIVQK